jgi:hypothetical protein
MPASQEANYIVLCARYIMNPTFFHLIFLFTAPLIWFSGNKNARLLVLLSFALAAAHSTELAVLSVGGVVAALAIDITSLLRLRSKASCRAILVYSAFCTLPLWMPAAWVYWPGHLLTNSEWQPAYNGWLYEAYGSADVLPTVEYWQPVSAFLALGILLFAYDKLRDIINRTSDIEE